MVVILILSYHIFWSTVAENTWWVHTCKDHSILKTQEHCVGQLDCNHSKFRACCNQLGTDAGIFGLCLTLLIGHSTYSVVIAVIGLFVHSKEYKIHCMILPVCLLVTVKLRWNTLRLKNALQISDNLFYVMLIMWCAVQWQLVLYLFNLVFCLHFVSK